MDTDGSDERPASPAADGRGVRGDEVDQGRVDEGRVDEGGEPVAGDGWTAVVVDAGPAGDPATSVAAELAADVVWGFGPPAVEEREVDGRLTVRSGFHARATARAAAAALRAAGHGAVAVHPVLDDGRDGWRPWAQVERAGPFLLVPAWRAERAAPPGGAGDDGDDGVALVLDPGPTFGSGSHPTTRLTLAAAARVLDRGAADPDCLPAARVLDVGTGSGVLAVGCAMLGATVDAIDVDPASPATVAANAARNGVAGRVRASDRTLAEVTADGAAPIASTAAGAGRPFDLVLANLLAPVVRELAPDLVRATRPGGHLVVSGLLADRWREATDHLTGADVEAVDEEDGWVAVTLHVPADGPGGPGRSITSRTVRRGAPP